MGEIEAWERLKKIEAYLAALKEGKARRASDDTAEWIKWIENYIEEGIAVEEPRPSYLR